MCVCVCVLVECYYWIGRYIIVRYCELFVEMWLDVFGLGWRDSNVMECNLFVNVSVDLCSFRIGRKRPGKIAAADGISRRQCGVLGVVFN